MRIAICDDEKIHLEKTRELIVEFFSDKGIELYIDSFESSEKFIKSRVDYDFAFLDIEMGEISGLKAAKKLREKKCFTLIFFITHFPFYLDHAMNMSPFRYLSKPLDKTRFFSGLSVALRKWSHSQKKIHLTDHKSKTGFLVNMHDILLIENSNRKTRVVTKRNEFFVTEKYKSLHEELILNEDFCETHQSFTINLNYISSHDNGAVWLEYGNARHMVYISRRKLADFKLKFFKFAGDIK